MHGVWGVAHHRVYGDAAPRSVCGFRQRKAGRFCRSGAASADEGSAAPHETAAAFYPEGPTRQQSACGDLRDGSKPALPTQQPGQRLRTIIDQYTYAQIAGLDPCPDAPQPPIDDLKINYKAGRAAAENGAFGYIGQKKE